jgi:hypothetical protein
MSFVAGEDPFFVFLVFRAVMTLFWFAMGFCRSAVAAIFFVGIGSEE